MLSIALDFVFWPWSAVTHPLTFGNVYRHRYLAAYTGARRGELLNLHRRDLDLDLGEVRITDSGMTSRTRRYLMPGCIGFRSTPWPGVRSAYIVWSSGHGQGGVKSWRSN